MQRDRRSYFSPPNMTLADPVLPPPPLGSIFVRASARGAEQAGVRSPTASHQRRKTGRFALLSLALGVNELGNQLGGSESV